MRLFVVRTSRGVKILHLAHFSEVRRSPNFSVVSKKFAEGIRSRSWKFQGFLSFDGCSWRHITISRSSLPTICCFELPVIHHVFNWRVAPAVSPLKDGVNCLKTIFLLHFFVLGHVLSRPVSTPIVVRFFGHAVNRYQIEHHSFFRPIANRVICCCFLSQNFSSLLHFTG